MQRLTLTVAFAFAAAAPLAAQSKNNAADVQFMQGMVFHHAQALEMVALIADHTKRPEMQLIGQRISISQHDEIAMMQRWLKEHGEVAPSVDDKNVAHMPDQSMPGMDMSGGTMMMPGMLTPDQMKALAAANGNDFDRLFLEGMIQHHNGAIAMVKTLLNTTGAAQPPQIFTFASDVDADQRAEIKRMQSVLASLPPK